mmetsp:Transcript_7351/g.15337  ORF Transcript_7351/g.15337 Transcript_7351/m.15337 type:complete len:217 (-) Transcript_7351:351-1001(-)
MVGLWLIMYSAPHGFSSILLGNITLALGHSWPGATYSNEWKWGIESMTNDMVETRMRIMMMIEMPLASFDESGSEKVMYTRSKKLRSPFSSMNSFIVSRNSSHSTLPSLFASKRARNSICPFSLSAKTRRTSLCVKKPTCFLSNIWNVVLALSSLTVTFRGTKKLVGDPTGHLICTRCFSFFFLTFFGSRPESSNACFRPTSIPTPESVRSGAICC